MHRHTHTHIYIRGGTVHVFVPNRHGTDLSVWLYDEYRQFTPNPEGGDRNNATLFDNHQRQQKNSECREFRPWKQSPLDSDHVLILYTYTYDLNDLILEWFQITFENIIKNNS